MGAEEESYDRTILDHVLKGMLNSRGADLRLRKSVQSTATLFAATNAQELFRNLLQLTEAEAGQNKDTMPLVCEGNRLCVMTLESGTWTWKLVPAGIGTLFNMRQKILAKASTGIALEGANPDFYKAMDDALKSVANLRINALNLK
ncbi:MAG: hypothetical protein WC843_03405 [Candidatus Gracilibacteria bacterium]|jgi:hypothetical protein